MPEDASVNIGALLDHPRMVRERVLGIQTKLHRWAVVDRDRRFDDLFNLVVDPAFLAMAWTRVRENKGAKTAGIDGATAWSIENSEQGVAGFLAELRSSVMDRSFRPVPVRTVMIPKANGKRRRLGIPTVRDRVVQASLKLVLEPILEADFDPCSYGLRPERRSGSTPLAATTMSSRVISPPVWMRSHTASFLIVMAGTVPARARVARCGVLSVGRCGRKPLVGHRF
jgi:RNA-directed DNA polymerase